MEENRKKNYKLWIKQAIKDIERIERIIKEEPSANIEDDKWLLDELDGVIYLLNGGGDV